jgi:sterol desaturase/sphingolipid hydroxylase (fatty acid hydroxylase superfamily)
MDSAQLLNLYLAGFVVAGLIAGVWSGYFKARKIQPKGFKWQVFRNEIGFAAFNLVVAALTLGPLQTWLANIGVITFKSGPAAWWVIALEFAAYFVLFDTWFYWLHRWMHNEPIYRWVHKIHHKSTSPNLLTTLSVNPLESLINGGFVPLFAAVFSPHKEAMALIAPFNILMGLYVHSGYEFLPRWWNRSWATKWFITTTFHDQHHKYFNYNFGGYTPVWDYLCGTVRKKYEADFDAVKSRATAPAAADVTAGEPSGV